MAEKIELRSDASLLVPDVPVIPYIEGDGVGRDIWRSSVRVFNAAIDKCYGSKKRVEWIEVYAGEKASRLKGDWAPKETIDTIRACKVAMLWS